MDSRNDLIGKKVLIISNSIGNSYKKLYCSYVLGEITEYNPDTNKIMIIRNTEHADSPIEFKINSDNNDNRFATREPENNNEKWWYTAFVDDKAIQLLKLNLLKQNNRRPVYKSYYLSTICYGKHKSKKEYLTYLLNELNNKSE
jgi:hypothetical protein|nr:MAG TPA: hypothetical protein [Bacteriophage sp.]